jgi:hypothetical protein
MRCVIVDDCQSFLDAARVLLLREGPTIAGVALSAAIESVPPPQDPSCRPRSPTLTAPAPTCPSRCRSKIRYPHDCESSSIAAVDGKGASGRAHFGTLAPLTRIDNTQPSSLGRRAVLGGSLPQSGWAKTTIWKGKLIV